jgi:hypothetical protein
MCWLFVGYVSIDIWLQYGFHGVGHMKEKKLRILVVIYIRLQGVGYSFVMLPIFLPYTYNFQIFFIFVGPFIV